MICSEAVQKNSYDRASRVERQNGMGGKRENGPPMEVDGDKELKSALTDAMMTEISLPSCSLSERGAPAPEDGAMHMSAHRRIVGPARKQVPI